jgi:hypothetical protein
VVVVDGGLRAVCEVQGVPLSAWSREEAEGFLRRWASVLNAVRAGGVQFVARSRDGGLRAAVEHRRADAAEDGAAPYREMGLAAARHLEALMRRGDARTLEFLLVVPGKREHEIDSDVATYEELLGQIGMGLRRLEEPELSLRLAAATRPDVPAHWYAALGSDTSDDAQGEAPATERFDVADHQRDQRRRGWGWHEGPR